MKKVMLMNTKLKEEFHEIIKMNEAKEDSGNQFIDNSKYVVKKQKGNTNE